MIFDAVMLATSALLLLYWFRYTCLLILRVEPARDYSRQVAKANHLKVFEIQAVLAVTPAGSEPDLLDKLERLLDRDYRLLLYLTRHAESFKNVGSPVEQFMLRGNYRIMKSVFACTKIFSVSPSPKPLAEMAMIITRFAHAMGERAALASAQ